MKIEQIHTTLGWYVDRLSNLHATLDAVAEASNIADAFLLPLETLRGCHDSLDDFRKEIWAAMERGDASRTTMTGGAK